MCFLIYREQQHNCNHVFHEECIDKWKERNNTCPICRKDLKEDAIIKAKNNSNDNISQFYNSGHKQYRK